MQYLLRFVLCFSSLLLFFDGYAQPNSPSLTPELPSVLQPSPNAATLGKFLDQPISLHTGLPTVGIPLWQVKRGDIALDIALSYHGGGIKVDEPASWVGIGWTLQGAGMVTRTARGLPDDLLRFKQFDLPRLNRYFAQTMTSEERALFLSQVYRGELDSEPDLYNISVGGIACQFYMNSAGDFAAMPRELNLRIQYNAADSYGVQYTWLITDGRGVQYKFLDTERTNTTSYSPTTGGGSYGGIPTSEFDGDTSWALREIEDTKGNRVQFSYESEGAVFSNISSERFSYTNSHDPYCSGKGIGGSYTYTINQGNAQRLVAITCGQEQLRFIANPTARQDANYAYGLDRVEIRYGADVKRVFRFFTTYWGASAEGTRGVYYPDSQNQSRLRLDSVREESADSRLRKPAYRFTYYEGNLPYRNSAAQDHWGYYNGQDNRSRVSYTMGGSQAGANKVPNPVFSIMGTLASIRYPTGGMTTFTYEPNRYVHNVTAAPYDSVLATGVLVGDQTGYEFTRDIQFEITPAMLGSKRKIPVILDFTQNVSFDGKPIPPGNGNSGFSASPIIFVAGQPTQYIAFPVLPDSGRCAYMPVGHYVLRLSVIKEYLENPYVFLQAKLTALLTSEAGQVEVYGPGLRIKKVSQRFGVNPAVVHTYEYVDPATKKSSGQLGSLPSYEAAIKYHYVEHFNERAQYVYVCDCKEFTSTSKYPLLTTQGGYIGYSHVTEYLDSARIAGKTTHTFTNFDYFNDLNALDHQAFPYAPSGSQSWKRGLPLLTKVWSAPTLGASATAQLQVADSLQYGLLPNSSNWTYGLKLGMADRYMDSGLGSAQGLPWPDFIMGPQQLAEALTLVHYPLESDSYQLITKTSTQYAAGSQHRTASAYAYTPDTYQVRRVVSQNSDGSTTVQRQYFPSDFATLAPTSPLIKALVAANRLTIPVEQSQLRLSSASVALNRVPRLVMGIAHEYGAVKDPAGWPVFYLQKVQMANTSLADTSQHYNGGNMPSFYEEKARVIQVTQRGNPLTQITKQQQITSFKWGYDERYVQAVCQNARAGEFYYEGFEESGGSKAQQGAHSGIHYATVSFVVNWTRPNGRPYRLSYWYRQGNVWHYQQQPYSGPSVALVGGDAYDDVCIVPVDAQITTYTYEPLVGETSVTGPDGRTITYEYDGLGRLVRTRDDKGRILSQQQYHYAGK